MKNIEQKQPILERNTIEKGYEVSNNALFDKCYKEGRSLSYLFGYKTGFRLQKCPKCVYLLCLFRLLDFSRPKQPPKSRSVYSLPKQAKNLDPSYKTDLDF